MSEHAREPDEAMVERFAKQVAEIRQHGCHYAEGTCIECHKIARAALATPPAAERATQAASDLHQRAKDCVDAIEVACGVFFGVETAEWRDACLILTTEFIAISDSARQEAAQEVADWEARFELFWAAQQRGVDAWRAAHPGSELTLPDMAHMTTWFLEERERQYRRGFADAKAVYGSV